MSNSMNRRMNTASPLALASALACVGGVWQGASAQEAGVGPAKGAQPAMLETVYVSARKEEVAARIEAPNPMVVATREEIEKTNDLTLGDFLRRQPGISFSGPAGNIKDIRMRGLDKGYTQILVDGEPWLGSTKERQIQVDQLPMSMVDRIEIIRSPLPDMNAEGIGGTINIVLRRANADELNIKMASGGVWYPEGQKPQHSAQFNYARLWDNGVSLVVPVNVNDRHELKVKPKIVETFAAATGVRTALTETKEVEDNHVREFTIGPRLIYRPNAVDTITTHVFYNLNDGDKHKTTGNWTALAPASGTAFVDAGSSIEDEDKDRTSLMVGAEWQRKLSEAITATVGGGSQQASEDKYKPKISYSALGAVTSTEIEDATVRASSNKMHGRLNWKASDQHMLASGLEWRGEDRKDRKIKNGVLQTGLGDRFDIEESRYTAFVRDDWLVAQDHMLVSGFRYERRDTTSVDATGRERSGDGAAFNPSMAYRWTFAPGWRARLAGAQTLRAPKFENLTTAVASGSGSSTSPYVSGNPDLRPERALGVDVGVETDFYGRTGFVAFNYTQRRIKDAVEKLTRQEADGYYYQRPYNVPGVSRTQAYEIDTRFDLRTLGLKPMAVLANYSRFFSRKAGTNDPLGDQPRYVANVGMDWRVNAIQTLLGWRYNYQGKIRKSSQETESAQHLLDAFAYWDINASWSLRVSGSNLLNTKKTKYKPTFDTAGVLTGLTREQEIGGRGLLFTLETRL